MRQAGVRRHASIVVVDLLSTALCEAIARGRGVLGGRALARTSIEPGKPMAVTNAEAPLR